MSSRRTLASESWINPSSPFSFEFRDLWIAVRSYGPEELRVPTVFQLKDPSNVRIQLSEGAQWDQKDGSFSHVVFGADQTKDDKDQPPRHPPLGLDSVCKVLPSETNGGPKLEASHLQRDNLIPIRLAADLHLEYEKFVQKEREKARVPSTGPGSTVTPPESQNHIDHRASPSTRPLSLPPNPFAPGPWHGQNPSYHPGSLDPRYYGPPHSSSSPSHHSYHPLIQNLQGSQFFEDSPYPPPPQFLHPNHVYGYPSTRPTSRSPESGTPERDMNAGELSIVEGWSRTVDDENRSN